MDAVVLTWRWTNMLAIWFMVGALGLAVVFGAQTVRKLNGSNSQ